MPRTLILFFALLCIAPLYTNDTHNDAQQFEKQLENMIMHNLTNLNSPLAASGSLFLFYALNVKERLEALNKLPAQSKRAFLKFIEGALWANVLNAIIPRLTEGQPKNGWAYMSTYAAVHTALKLLKPYLKNAFTSKPAQSEDVAPDATDAQKAHVTKNSILTKSIAVASWGAAALCAYAITP